MNKAYFKTIIQHIVVWTIAIVFWSIMRQFGQELLEEPDFDNNVQMVLTYLSMGILAGLSFGSFDYFRSKYYMTHSSFGRALLLGGLSYLIIVFFIVILGVTVFSLVTGVGLNSTLYRAFVFSNEMALLVFYLSMVGTLIHFTQQIDRKFGPGNLVKMLTGEFYKPKVVERIFMFLDLKASTSIAEKLGHIRYSNLIQDCFRDLNIAQKSSAEIYQYVGDEAVLTWEKKKGLENANCLRAFFEFKNCLENKADYYQREYSLMPEFKAGLNIGEIVVAEVGVIKREIAYHGDTINIAARIQGECNTLGKELLISEELHKLLPEGPDTRIKLIGDVLLKGKTNKINICSVEQSYTVGEF
jgi:adenylate cyclase